MSVSRRPVRTGDELLIPAATWNALQRLLDRRLGSFGIVPGFGAMNGLVNVRNDSGADVGRFEVLAVTGVVFSSSDNLEGFKTAPLLKGELAAACSGESPTSPAGNWVVMQEAVASGGIGKGLVWGLTPVQVDVTNTAHRCCEIQPGVKTALKSGDSGTAKIIVKGASTSVQWCLVAVGVHHEAAPDGCEDEECAKRLGDITKITGYDGEATQYLRHVNGCAEWITPATCGG